MSWQPDIMIYHANCADGFGAAWSAWMRWGAAVQYLPYSYGQPAPDVTGKRVLIGDFSFKHDDMARLIDQADSVVVLDHHKTAKGELLPWICSGDFDAATIEDWWARFPKLPRAVALFDMDRSGAVMTWKFCHGCFGNPAPMLLELIQDRDLWRFDFLETKPFGLWLRSEPFDFERWELISQEMSDARDCARIMAEANAMQRFFYQKVSEIAALARRGRVGGHEVPVCNCPPMFASDVGHKLLADNPTAPFVACYSDQGNGRGWSLRSCDDRLDVSEIAQKFGGGGHRNAAGFGSPLV